MKAFVNTAVLLVILVGVNSIPLKGISQLQGYQPAFHPTTTSAREQGVPSESYLQEVKEQLEEMRKEHEENQESQHQRETRSASDDTGTCNSTTPMRHGSTVAFQAYVRHDWLRCSTTITSCGKSTCPLLYMEGNDWNTCRENVFQIFRAYGHGDVAVGDLIGLYLTRESGKWFDCSQTACRKSSCPGIANYEHGFDTREKWYRCYGSVFKIYARGKQLGETITDQDDIMLFYLQGLNWIRTRIANHHTTCPGTTRPPPYSKFDMCAGAVYKIWKRY